ncbi:MAG: glycosyltransferase family 1 protein, partial [Variovorax sp.]
LSGRPWLRHLVKTIAPAPLQLWAWRHFSRITYSNLSAALPPADFGAGDILVAGDAGWGYDVWACARAAQRRGARVVTILYDLIPLNHPEYCSEAHQLLFRQWLPGALATSDAILCISEASRAELARHCEANQLRCAPSAAFRLGGDLPPAAAHAPASSRMPAGAPYFLSVGSIEPRKDHALLLDAFERAWSGGLDARLAIVGRPVDGAQATVARIRAHAELGKRLFLFTDADDAELDTLYRGARAVVLASRAEGFGLPLVEARQRGCAVMATRLPAFEERADEGVRLFA